MAQITFEISEQDEAKIADKISKGQNFHIWIRGGEMSFPLVDDKTVRRTDVLIDVFFRDAERDGV